MSRSECTRILDHWTKDIFDVSVFNPLNERYREQNFEKCYDINEKQKKKHYNERIQNAEHDSFPPVMSAN